MKQGISLIRCDECDAIVHCPIWVILKTELMFLEDRKVQTTMWVVKAPDEETAIEKAEIPEFDRSGVQAFEVSDFEGLVGTTVYKL